MLHTCLFINDPSNNEKHKEIITILISRGTSNKNDTYDLVLINSISHSIQVKRNREGMRNLNSFVGYFKS